LVGSKIRDDLREGETGSSLGSVPQENIKKVIARLGAIEYLTVCVVALEYQEARLRAAKPPDATGMDSFYELAPDVWFAVVALHRSFRALDLAAQASERHSSEIQGLSGELPDREATKRVRDVYEHFDDYFQLKGKLQKTEQRRDMHLPQVGVRSGPGGVSSVEVAIGNEPVDVFATIQVMIPALRNALTLLESENVAPPSS
jgi:hypothetical protein